ncbi:MAG: hypothetical protein RBR99_04225 [Dehalococcoidales bacterium]|jgi:hypothetical protein|nr:hypothetical protein [Dehalococcoidales bacterium]MDX9986649.1 hypothetical protein [Dehalococcoidales bacterium]
MKKIFTAQKKFIAFFTIIPLLTLTAFIKAPCPVCEEHGSIPTTSMAWVSVRNVEATVGGTYLAVCGIYRVYLTTVTVTLLNTGDSDANGYLSLQLVDYTTGYVIDNQYVVVNIPANMQLKSSYDISFLTNVDDPQTVTVAARPVIEQIADQACDGTGMVRLNEWPLWYMMQHKALKAQQETVEKPAFIPIFIPPEEWESSDEYEMQVYDEFSGY